MISPALKEQMLQHAKNGFGLETMATLGVTSRDINEEREADPSFRDFLDLCSAHQLYYWESLSKATLQAMLEESDPRSKADLKSSLDYIKFMLDKLYRLSLDNPFRNDFMNAPKEKKDTYISKTDEDVVQDLTGILSRLNTVGEGSDAEEEGDSRIQKEGKIDDVT